ncbi:MAG: hypothetical protein JZU52_06230 [Lamprocystis purpurea]|uniref:hypothetical protein n=1 Tax=Lamprocystis purpurea TaxID=61598 RepID=UPI00036984E4|nr:hypothetical protein [Lamprocystis purpurea]MBV5273239.1 hypothetical protein [Lamprocystis purpurea]
MRQYNRGGPSTCCRIGRRVRSLTRSRGAAVGGRQRLLERSLIGIRRGRGWLLPRYQFQVQQQDGQPVVRALVPGIEQVVPRLSPELHPVALWRWFSSPSSELVLEDEDAPLSPRDWLIAGRDPAAVARLAAGL